MKTQQLPTELVEKMQVVLDTPRSYAYPGYDKRSEQCAQIAVEYADEWRNDQYQVQKAVISELQKQRDELLEALRYISVSEELPYPGFTILARVNGVPEYHLAYMLSDRSFYSLNSNCVILPTHWRKIPTINNNESQCNHSNGYWCSNCYEIKKDEIIGLKKHEDGKE